MNLDKKQIKAIFITAILILFILLFMISAFLVALNSNKSDDKINISAGFSSVKELVEHHGCKYKNDTYVENRKFIEEVNLEFGKALHVNGVSNEDYFNKIINDLATFVRFVNFKMIDTENDITIEVVCLKGKIDTITINGVEDYFIYIESQLALEKYKEIDTTSFTIDAPILNTVIENNWSTSTEFGTRDSIFQDYNIYFDEGIRFRKIGSNIYNIIFTNKYLEPVISNIRTGIPLSSVEQSLGKPTFKDEEIGVIGYKGKDIYVFFTKDEISVYKHKTYDYSSFWELIDEFVKEDMEFKEFMNELTYIWPDYSEYTYDNDYMFISYPNRGIDVKLNYDNISGIVVYNNISEEMNKVKKYLENTEFISRLQIDNVFEAEKRRVSLDNKLLDNCKEFIKTLEEDLEEGEELLCGKSEWFKFYMDLDNSGYAVTTYFISETGEFANRELNEPIDTYVWISDNYFVYSIYEKGIYCYNAVDGTKQTLVEGEESFNIKSFVNFVLTYDDNKTIELAF